MTAAHRTEVIGKPPIPGALGKARRWVYQARCSCDWRGEDHATSGEAHEDAACHEIAVEEAPAR